jgi:hypothetical protein
MRLALVKLRNLGHTRLQVKVKGETLLQAERVLRMAIFVAELRDSSPSAHEIKIRAAKKLVDLIEEFIAEEVNAANSKPKDAIGHLSWAQVGNLLELSRSAVYARYARVRESEERN